MTCILTRLPVNTTFDSGASARAANGIIMSIGNNALDTGYSRVPFQEKGRSVGDSKFN
jgi:hypothetical protein